VITQKHAVLNIKNCLKTGHVERAAAQAIYDVQAAKSFVFEQLR